MIGLMTSTTRRFFRLGAAYGHLQIRACFDETLTKRIFIEHVGTRQGFFHPCNVSQRVAGVSGAAQLVLNLVKIVEDLLYPLFQLQTWLPSSLLPFCICHPVQNDCVVRIFHGHGRTRLSVRAVSESEHPGSHIAS